MRDAKRAERCWGIFVLFALVLISMFVFGCMQQTPLVGEGRGEEMVANGKKVLMVIAPTNFRDEEYLEPRSVFEKAGVNVTVASKGTGIATGMLGVKVAVDIDIADADVSEYDAVVFIGGAGSAVYFNDSTALSMAKESFAQGKITAAICIASSILANAGVLKSKNATSWPSEQQNIEAKGGHYTGDLVTQDGKIITGKGPAAATQFGKKVVEALSGTPSTSSSG